jgi:segregation and condensation protein A
MPAKIGKIYFAPTESYLSGMHPEADSYKISLPQFEGPFDLLLFFIERDELDIHDIPIAKITKDFLAYLQAMKQMNIELASEFILVAGTLMKIKAQMLIPRPVLNEAGEEVDPREELVRRLLEYKRYKSILEDLSRMEEAQSERSIRGNIQGEEKEMLVSDFPEEEMVGIDLFTLMRAFNRIWDRHKNELEKPQHVIRKYPYSVEEIKETILSLTAQKGRIDFVTFILEKGERIFVVFSFLAILELVQVQKLEITVGEGFNNFWLSQKTTKE